MDMMTVNISMPKSLYAEAKKKAKRYHYASISELVRNALRWWLSDEDLTVNGFTPEFEAEVLEAEKEADKGNVVRWDGKTPFTKFVLTHPVSARNAKRRVHRKISGKIQKVAFERPEFGGRSQPAGAMV